MIDTLRLTLSDTIIKDNANILIQPGEIDLGTGLQSEFDLFVTQSGDVIRGKKAFINNDFFNLTILPKQSVFTEKLKKKKVEYLQKVYGRAPDGSIELDKKELIYELQSGLKYNSRCFLQTSLPKLNNYLDQSNTYNLKPLNEDQIKRAVYFLSTSLEHYGILTDLDEANLSRLDLFNNINTSLPFLEYREIFSRLNLSKKNLSEYAGETFLFKNKSSQFTIYDKTKELLIKHKITVPANVMRFENRLLNKRKVLNSLGCRHIKQILNISELKKNMIDAGNLLFKFTPLDIEIIDLNFLFEKLNELKSENRYWLNKFYYNEGLYSVLSRVPRSQLLYVLKDLLTRDKYSKAKKQIDNFDFSLSIFSNSKLKSLYNELKGKYFETLAA